MALCCLIFGFGYTAKALAPKLIAQDFQVIGTVRSAKNKEQNHLDIKRVDFNCQDMKNYISAATHLLICIPPTSTMSDLVLTQFGDLIKKQAPSIQWMGYLSSTGVYGDHQGNWVDEASECIPHTLTGVARLKAENAWLSFAKEYQLPLHVFRLSGIYGPERNALTRLMQGKKQSVFKEGQVFCRIHVEDICSTLMASMKAPKPLSIYNVSDDEPAPAHLVDNYAATLLHREPPLLVPYSEITLSTMEQEFYANNRRVSNSKIKKDLGVVLHYPTYKEGLAQIWKADFSGN